MLGIILDYYIYQRSYLILKFKNLVKFCVHISPIFSCPVTYSEEEMEKECHRVKYRKQQVVKYYIVLGGSYAL